MKIIRTKGIESILPIKINVSKTRWKEIQIRLFSLGCRWIQSGDCVIDSYEQYLFVDTKKYIRYTDDENYFNERKYKEVSEYKLL